MLCKHLPHARGIVAYPPSLELHQWVTDYRAYFSSGSHLSLLTNKGTRPRGHDMLQNSANCLQVGKANIQSKPGMLYGCLIRATLRDTLGTAP